MARPSYILSILVKNEPGVLSKIAQLFYRRGYNIETITVGKTQTPGLSKIVISVPLDERDTEYLRRQTENLIDVHQARLLDRSQCLQTEVCLMRIGYEDEADRQRIMNLAQPYRPRLRDIDDKSIVLRVAGKPELIDGFVRTLDQNQVEILDVSRTGMTALGPRPDMVTDAEIEDVAATQAPSPAQQTKGEES